MTGMEILRSWKPLDVVVNLSGGVVLLLLLSGLTSVMGSETLAALFAFDEEANVVTWYAIFLWLFLAVVLRLMARKYERASRRQVARAASTLAYLAVFFSIDEAAGLSLKIRLIIQDFDMTPETLDQDQIWLFLYGSLLALILLAITPGLVELSKVSPKCVTGLAVGGAALLAAGFGFEVIPSIKSLSFEPVLEEVLELGAVILMIWGALHGLGLFQMVERYWSDAQDGG
jgi:hypothetical protein